MSVAALSADHLAPARAVVPTHEDAWLGIDRLIAQAHPKGRYKVLEAGGGSLTALGALARADVTVIDISAEQLARNAYADTRLEGDLQTFDAYPERYDVIVCRDVLEHLEQPQAALQRLLAVLAPGGILVIGGPAPTSFKGLLTKFSPHGVHVAYYRWIIGEPNAGKPGYAPFKAFMSMSIRPAALKRTAARAGLGCVYEALTPPSWMLERMAAVSPLLPAAYNAAMAVLRALSFGTWRPDLSDMVLAFRAR